MSSFISQLGSKEALEEYFKKSISELKIEFYDVIYNQLLTQRMQSSITSSVNITPEEVKIFFKQMKESSDIPVMPTTLEISQIVMQPVISDEEKERIRNNINY